MSEITDHTAAFEEDDDLDAGLAAAFGPGASVMASLCQSLPGLRPVQLREPAEAGSGVVERPNSKEMPSASATGRYQVFGEIARGGMGAVLRGRDPDLGRDIAIKVLRDDHRTNTRMIERFVEEAQIGGQLQHPGIVPVYELNQFSDQRPYFTMKLVKGRTLAALFHDRKSPDDGRARLVAIFAQVAQTVAYAHSRGVIHRDLKPANIMIGNFGEVQVMDWGLAKVLPTGGIADEERSKMANRSRAVFAGAVSEIRTLRSAGSGSDTQAGSLLGTPAYMAPEQARGDNDLVDERSDVFGLGAILCELLTGKPPFTGETQAEVQRKAGLGQLEDAMTRLDASTAEKELVDLARRCLAAEPWDRPRDAKTVADAANTFLAATDERLRKAQQDRAVAEARSIEERKRRHVAWALAAAIILLLAGGGGGAWWWLDRKAAAGREAEIARVTAAQAVERGLSEAAQYRDAGRLTEAQIAASKAAEFLLKDARADLQKRVADLQADLKLLIALDENRIRFSGERQEVFDHVGANTGYESAFRDFGVDVASLDPATAQSRFSPAIQVPVAEAFDHWAQTRMKYFDDPEGWKRLMERAQAVDVPNPWRQRLRKARLEKDTKTQLDLARNPDRLTQPPAILVVLARNLRDGHNEPGMALDVMREARLRYPGDFWINFELGETCMRLNRPGEAVRYYNAALASRPNNTYVMTSVAWALCGCSDGKECETICRRVIQLRPEFEWAHGLLGYALMNHATDEAIKENHIAMQLDPKNPNWPNNLGVCHKNLKQFAEAEANYRKALTVAPDYSMALHNLVELLQEQNRKADVIALYRESVQRQPDALDRRARLAEQTGEPPDIEEAIACFRRSLAKAPANVGTTWALVKLLQKQGRKKDIIAVWKDALVKSPGSLDFLTPLAFESRDPADIEAAIVALRVRAKTKHDDVATTYRNLGIFLRFQRKYPESEVAFRDGVRLAPNDLGMIRGYNHLLTDWGRRTEAIAMLREAAKRVPNDSLTPFELASHLYELGNAEQAVMSLERSLALDSNRFMTWNMLAFSRFRLGHFAEAREAMTQAAEAARKNNPNDDISISRYAARARDMARLAELANDLPAIIDGTIQPKDAAEGTKFGQVCQYRGFLAPAMRFYQSAFSADSSLARSFELHQAACGAIKLSTQTKSPMKAAQSRQQALDWLRGDLARVDKLLTGNTRGVDEGRRWLNRWLEDESYNPVRDPAALAKLPAEERTAWEQYWTDLKTRAAKVKAPEVADEPNQ